MCLFIRLYICIIYKSDFVFLKRKLLYKYAQKCCKNPLPLLGIATTTKKNFVAVLYKYNRYIYVIMYRVVY